MLRDVGSSLCFVSVAAVSKYLGLGFPPAAVKGDAGWTASSSDWCAWGRCHLENPFHPATLGCCGWCWVYLQPSERRCLYCKVQHRCSGVTSLLAVSDVALGWPRCLLRGRCSFEVGLVLAASWIFCCFTGCRWVLGAPQRGRVPVVVLCSTKQSVPRGLLFSEGPLWVQVARVSADIVFIYKSSELSCV